jgi:hypothetical protein
MCPYICVCVSVYTHDSRGAAGVVGEESEIQILTRSNIAATGNVDLTILGQNFGIGDYSAVIFVGDTAGIKSQWIADTSVNCLVGGGERAGRLVRQYLCNVCEPDLVNNINVKELFGQVMM